MSSMNPVKIIQKTYNEAEGTEVTIIVENPSAKEAAKEIKVALKELELK